MAELDRRKNDERRNSKRYEVHIDIQWETHYGRRAGTLSDISEQGCFVLTSAEMSDGELARIYVPRSDGGDVEFLGQVANSVTDIGFGVHFMSLSDAQKEFLTSFVALHANDTPR